MNERIVELNLSSLAGARFFLICIDSITPNGLIRAKKNLNDEDIQKANKFIFQEDRERCMIVYATVKIVLGTILAIETSQLSFVRNSFGKPFLQGHLIHFNWSHSGRYALLGVHPTHPIGVDIEKIRQSIFLDDFLHPLEREWVDQLPESRSDKFCQLWAAKEAYVKALGIGLSQAIPRLEVVLNAQKDLSHFNAHLPGFSSLIVESSNVVNGYKLATCIYTQRT